MLHCGIGQALSLLLKTQLPAESKLALYDVAPVVPGVAVDLSHIPTDVAVTGHGKDELEAALTGADIVLILPVFHASQVWTVLTCLISTLGSSKPW